jgi:hypothetical protein
VHCELSRRSHTLTEARLASALDTWQVVLRSDGRPLDDGCVIVPSSGSEQFVAAAPAPCSMLSGWGRLFDPLHGGQVASLRLVSVAAKISISRSPFNSTAVSVSGATVSTNLNILTIAIEVGLKELWGQISSLR